MSNLISSTMLRSSPLATSLSSGALSSIQALALSPAAAVLASTSSSLLTPTHPSSATSTAFIPPVANVLVQTSRSSSLKKSMQQPPLHMRRPSFVNPSSSHTSSPMLFASQQSEEPTFAGPNMIPTDDAFVPSNKSLRHQLHIPREQSSEALPQRGADSSPLPRVVGHRGALYDELENTREGFQRCADLGCDAVELDVFLLKDHTLIVFHGGGSDDNPGDLLDYCGVEGNILDLTYEEAQKLGFNANFEEFPCPVDKIQQGRIPTLEQVLLDLKPTKTHIKIELKGPGVVEPVLELVDRLGMVGQCEFSSFEHDRIKLLRDLRPEKGSDGRYVYKTGALFEDIPDDFVAKAVEVGASEVHLRYDYCTVERISAIHAAGMDSMCWYRGPIGMKSDVTNKYWDIGNEDERCYQALIDTGVKQLCVNRPDVLIGLLKKQQPDFEPQILSTTMMEDVLPIIPVVVDDDESMTSASSSSS